MHYDMVRIIHFIMVFFILFLVGCSGKTETKEITSNIVVSPDIPKEEPKVYCKDSDNGINKDVSGTAEGELEDGFPFEFDDRCVGNILIEYYCEDSKYTNQNIRCENICEDGACK